MRIRDRRIPPRGIIRRLVIRGLTVFVPAAAFAFALHDFGVLWGATIALASFYVARCSLSLILRFTSKPAAAAMASFFLRLSLLGLVFFLLASLTELNTVAVLSSFILLYTLLLFLEMMLVAFPPSRIGSRERS